jgi:hypothetical protein
LKSCLRFQQHCEIPGREWHRCGRAYWFKPADISSSLNRAAVTPLWFAGDTQDANRKGQFLMKEQILRATDFGQGLRRFCKNCASFSVSAESAAWLLGGDW